MEICETPWGKMYFSWQGCKDVYEIEMHNEVTCPKGGIAIDLGAHQGYYTTKLAKEAGKDGLVFAFEPEPINFKILCDNIELNNLKNVIPIQKAVSNYIGTGSLFTYNIEKGWDSGKHFLRGSTLREAWGTELNKEISAPFRDTKVEVTTLNAIKEEYDLKRVDIIKMDVEGAELKIIEGASKFLIQLSPKIVVEVHFRHNIAKSLVNYGYTRTRHFEHVTVSSNPISVFEKGVKKMRENGSPEAKIKCLKPVLDNLDEVEELINKILETKNLTAENIFIFQSRAMGTCHETSDFDTYVALSKEHTGLIEDRGVILYEGRQPTQFSGNWHSIELEPIDPYTLGYRWPHKILHDMDAPKFYEAPPSVPQEILDRLDEYAIHINYGVHPLPPRKIEYENELYYISFSELRKLKGEMND